MSAEQPPNIDENEAETPPRRDAGDEAAPPDAGSPAQPEQPAEPGDAAPAMRAVPPSAREDDDEETDDDDDDDPAQQRGFEADPSLALPGVQEVARPGFRDPRWVNTEPDERDRFEPIPTLVNVPASDGEEPSDAAGGEDAAVAEPEAAGDDDDAGTTEPVGSAAPSTTPPAALESGVSPDWAALAAAGEGDAEEEAPVPQTVEQVAQAMEALLFVCQQPLSGQRLRDLLGLDSVVPIRQAAARLRDEYGRRGRAFELVERAGGYVVQTRPEFAPFVLKLQRERQAQRISPAALTTLSIIAYRQPLTRSEVDAIRGVGSSHHIRSLMERGLIKVVGRKSVPGNPSLYGTTAQFLRQFGLRSLRDLPQEADFDEVDEQALRAQSQADTAPADDAGNASAFVAGDGESAPAEATGNTDAVEENGDANADADGEPEDRGDHVDTPQADAEDAEDAEEIFANDDTESDDEEVFDDDADFGDEVDSDDEVEFEDEADSDDEAAGEDERAAPDADADADDDDEVEAETDQP